MSTSFSYVIFPHHRRRDGTIAVTIRMIHNRTAKYHASSIIVTKEQLTRRLDKITDTRVLEEVNAMLDDYRRKTAEIHGADWMSADELWRAIEAKMRVGFAFHLDVFEYAALKMQAMEPKTAEGYRSALNMLERFLGRRSLDINEITRQFVAKFRAFIEKETSKGSRATSYYLSCLRHIHNLARDEFNDEDAGMVYIARQPFRGAIIPPQPVTRHRDLTVEQIRAVMAANPVTARGQLARDVFMLSFCLVGMNTVDLYQARKSDLADGILTYQRAKTDSRRADKATIAIRIEPEIAGLVEKYRDRNKAGDYLFTFHNRYSDHRNFNKYVNIGLKELADGLQSYHARHSWATIARNDCGIDFDTVHGSLNHATEGEKKVTDIYLRRDFSKIWEANRQVLDVVFGKKKERVNGSRS